MIQLIVNVFRKKEKKGKLFRLECECSAALVNEAQAADIIDQMTICGNCSEPIYLVEKVTKSS